MRILVINAGSSSLKHALVDSRDGGTEAAGTVRWEHDSSAERHAEALREVLSGLPVRPDAAGHRVVHGGERFAGPVVVTPEVMEAIAALADLAPLHIPAALDGIRAVAGALPGLPQVASFDTAFHRTLPPSAATLALPASWRRRFGLRRYGFHGLNVAWCAARAREQLGPEATRRTVVCHLGSGCSVTAVRDGRSVDTTMGFTPLDGVPMATRPGALDPGVLLHLLAHGVTREELEHGLEHESGLLGVSGISADVREIVAAADRGDADAQLALEVFVHGVARAVGSMAAALGGLDCLVITGGVGEHAEGIRAAILRHLGHLGVGLETGADVPVLVVAAGEEIVIAREAAEALGQHSGA
jgi:acetate kinase